MVGLPENFSQRTFFRTFLGLFKILGLIELSAKLENIILGFWILCMVMV